MALPSICKHRNIDNSPDRTPLIDTSTDTKRHHKGHAPLKPSQKKQLPQKKVAPLPVLKI